MLTNRLQQLERTCVGPNNTRITILLGIAVENVVTRYLLVDLDERQQPLDLGPRTSRDLGPGKGFICTGMSSNMED